MERLYIDYIRAGGGGGGTLIFSSYVGKLGPGIYCLPQKDFWNIRHTPKLFEILATPQIIISPFKIQGALRRLHITNKISYKSYFPTNILSIKVSVNECKKAVKNIYYMVKT